MKNKFKIIALMSVLILGLLAFAGCGGNSSYDGEWTAVKAVAFGEEMSAEEANMTMTMTIDGDKVTISDGESEDIVGTLSWDGDKGSIELEMTEEEKAQMEELGMDLTMGLTEEDGQLVLDMYGLAQVYFEK